MTRPITIAAIVAIAAVAFAVAARADDKPSGPRGYILTCGIAGPGSCIWVNGEWPQPVVPVPRPRPRMEIPATETGKG